MRPRALRFAALFGPAALWCLGAAAGLAWTASDESAWGPVDRHGAPVEGSDSCARCHVDEWATWHRSWHRTMTQRPRPAAAGPLAVAELGRPRADPSGQSGVLAPFAGEHLDYLGFRATMDRAPSGAPRIRVDRLTDVDGAGQRVGARVLDVEVALTVGSHRYQQYVAYLDRGDGPTTLWRLPVAWHRDEARWIHMNGAFVEPEGEAGSLPDYTRHLSRWNDNCVFCHNTQPVPGKVDGRAGFETAVGELGIACEACHGPGREHARRHENPLRRLLARGREDGSIAHPGRMPAARESDVCGRCHGQRIGGDIAAILEHGDGFVPGDTLADVSRPIFADSTIPGVAGLDEGQPFAARFWPDGTPRLSAYEYQGLLLSPCSTGEPALGCNHCHDMHGDDPDGQVRAGRRGEGACVDCHTPGELSGADGHGGHGDHPSAIDCLDCHMPAITYGLLEGMISHRITTPDPGAWIGRSDQPDACTQCHVDRSRAWAAREMATLGLRGTPLAGVVDEADEHPRALLDLLGGDPLQRNLAAHAIAQPGATGPARTRLAWLLAALEDDYPSVRWFAWRGVRELAATLPAPERARVLAAVERFDYLGPIAGRVEAIEAIEDALAVPVAPPFADQPALRERLLDGQVGVALWIGE